MADQQAAPAPAVTAPATTEAVSAPAETPSAAVAKKPAKTGAARHAEIREKLATAPAEGANETPAPEKPVDAPPPEPEKPKPAVGAVMRLTSENSKLKTQIEELQAAVTKANGSGNSETVAALRERVKKDPAVLLDIFGADLDEDETKRLGRLSNAWLDRADPESAKQREVLSKIEKLEQELQQEREGKKVLAQQDKDGRARAHTAKVLTDGHKADDGTVVIDPTKYPYVNQLTKAGEVDAHAGVMYATREMADAFREKNKREPNDTEIVTMIGIAAGEAEAYFAKRAKNWELPGAAPPPAEEPPTKRTPTTIGAGLGSRAPSAVDTSGLSKAEKHALIREKLRRAQAQSAN
jgi:hypothetical protein